MNTNKKVQKLSNEPKPKQKLAIKVRKLERLETTAGRIGQGLC